MPRAPITYQSRPQKWDDLNLTQSLNSFQYGVLKALDLLSESECLDFPGFEYVPTSFTDPIITINTINDTQPYPAPSQKKWLRNRGRLAISASTFVIRDLWPTPIIMAAAHRVGTDLSLSPKLALAMLAMTVPAAYTSALNSGLSPHLDKIVSSNQIEHEDHGVQAGADRKFPSDVIRELVRLGREPDADLMPFAWIVLNRPSRSLLFETQLQARIAHDPVPASWLYDVSRLSGIPVTAFVRYAEYEYLAKGATYMDIDTLTELIALLYEASQPDMALELESNEWQLPVDEMW